MVAGTLFTYADSFRGFKCRIAAAYASADIKVVTVEANDKSAQHVPYYVTDEKKVELFTDEAIAYFLANDQLRGGSCSFLRASVLQWTSYANTEVSSAVASWVYPAISLVESTPAMSGRAMADTKRCFAFLNEHLKTRTYLVGERITLADISVACELMLAYQHVVEESFRKNFDNVNRWFNTVINQDNFKKVTGEITLCVKAAQFNATTFAENKKKSAPEKKPKADKPKAEPKPKAKPAPKKEEEEEDDDLVMVEAPKNDPFAAMPKGNWNMDEFKRTFSNEDTLTVAMPYFFNKFEKEFYSVWKCEYKYSSELSRIFMTSNLIGGMFQRIEKLRKNAFASMCIWGSDNDSIITGIWFWKGQDLAFPLCTDWMTDYESYEWTKLDIDSEEVKKDITRHFNWEGEYKGKAFNSGKIFK